jgi:predicted aldo/keto reductase-like oxidoreductase
MLYRNNLSILGLGCMRLPLNSSDPNDIDKNKSIQMIRYAIDHGINYIDTAFTYHSKDHISQGESEYIIGQALTSKYRKKVNIATKLPSRLITCHKDMHTFLDKQLKILNIRYIDYYLLHHLNQSVWNDLTKYNVLQFLNEALKDGRIKHTGFSFHDSFNIFQSIIDSYDWNLVQLQYNYLDREYQAGLKGIDYAYKKKCLIVIMEPLRGGYLVNNIPDQYVSKLYRYHSDWSLATWGLYWLWNQYKISVVLSGMSTLDQLQDNIISAETYKDNCFTKLEQEIIDELTQYFETSQLINCTQCQYCLSCIKHLPISDLIQFLNKYNTCNDIRIQKQLKRKYSIYFQEQEQASQCALCNICSVECPQWINIPKILKHICKTFS